MDRRFGFDRCCSALVSQLNVKEESFSFFACYIVHWIVVAKREVNTPRSACLLACRRQPSCCCTSSHFFPWPRFAEHVHTVFWQRGGTRVQPLHMSRSFVQFSDFIPSQNVMLKNHNISCFSLSLSLTHTHTHTLSLSLSLLFMLLEGSTANAIPDIDNEIIDNAKGKEWGKYHCL